MQETDTIAILTNTPDEATALMLADKLVTSRAAACVNCLPAVQSTYLWQGKVEQASEFPLLIKTSRANYAEVERVIRENHPYDVPEVIALPIVTGLPAYLQWIASETAAGS